MTLAATAQQQPQQPGPHLVSSSLHWWPPSQHEHQMEFEAALNQSPSARSLRAFHDQLASEPHITGTPGDARMISRLGMALRMLGKHVDEHEFWAYLSHPVDAALEIIAPQHLTLSIKEEPIPNDRFSRDRALTFGYNAYSASGDVTASVVYANYGTREDFEKLRELGIDCTGKIVLARYGKNYRGYKAKFAEQAGAAALIMYTDPKDSGYTRGPVYPEGGWANEHHIQRGSIKTLDYAGDPLTPGVAAKEDAPRLDPEQVDLPRIPVQPIGYGAAREIMQRMTGHTLPDELKESWQGGLPFDYRLEGGEDLRVRVMVKQERRITKSANIIATMWGQVHPEQKIIIGCHHDAWNHGASDPLAGLILVTEVAHAFFRATQEGFIPARTIVFAAWGAEEHGIIGSTEYCEEFAELLSQDAVAYINLDMAAMGPNFHASAAPSLKRLIEEVTRDVPQARSEAGQKVHEAWRGERESPHFGNLGGGSDHVGFYCHLAIPSAGIGAGGAEGTAYHSNYDTLHWYRQVVGEDYEPALMLTRIVNLLAVRLANAPLLPLDPVQYAMDGEQHVQSLRKRAEENGIEADFQPLLARIATYGENARQVSARLEEAMANAALDPETLQEINLLLLTMEREWLRPHPDEPTFVSRGIQLEPIRSPEEHAAATYDTYLAAPKDGPLPWYRNTYAASDPYSGYAAWMLPDLRGPIERRDAADAAAAIDLYIDIYGRLSQRMDAIAAHLDAVAPVEP